MDNALAARPINALSTGSTDSFGSRMAALPLSKKLTMAVGVLALAGAIWALVAWNNTGDYKVLYANLSDKDGGAVTAQLSTMNVPYKFSEGGGAILVPASQVHDLRLKLATAGLPKGSVVGFELMENARFGLTQFQERLNFQRGLEGELTRSIQALAAVDSARVHLALPNQNGFFREQQKPSASVLLTLHPGRTLDRSQMAGIIHLVASSVPELDPKAVSVLDSTGSLLSGSPDGSNGTGLDAQQLQYVNQIEQSYSKRVLDLLEPVVGRENLRAQVTADVDFSQTEATSEEFKPNQNNQQATIRSQQSTEQSGGTSGAPAAGIPGAASNQPQAPASAPINGAAQQMQVAQGSGGSGTSNSRREAVTNYEVDKTVRVTRNATGTVKRLNAAVVVNHRTVTEKGKATHVALTDAEIEKLTALVQESIGFNKNRGDSVKVINAPFQEDTTVTPEVPLWKQPQTLDMIRTVFVPGSLTLLALIIVFSLIRPSLKAAIKPATPALDANGRQIGTTLDAVVSDAETFPDGSRVAPGAGAIGTNGATGADANGNAIALPAPKVVEHLAAARKLAKDNPAQVAGILRGWTAAE